MKLNRFCAKYSVVVGLIALLCMGSLETALARQTAKESQIKAVFLYNFITFITWPAKHLENSNEYKICVLGDDPFDGELDAVVSDQKARNRVLRVQHFKLSELNKVQMCHILFISRGEKAALARILRFTNQFPILTVSDIEDFVLNCGMIEFFKVKKKVRISVNLPVLTDRGLKANANLLKLSHVDESACQE